MNFNNRQMISNEDNLNLKYDDTGRIIISERKKRSDILPKDKDGRIIIQTRKQSNPDYGNYDAEESCYDPYYGYEQELSNEIDWSKPNNAKTPYNVELAINRKEKKHKKDKKDKKNKSKKTKKKNKQCKYDVYKIKDETPLNLHYLENIQEVELNERKNNVPSILSEIINQTSNIIVTQQNDIFIYDPKDGCFVKKDKQEIDAYISSYLTPKQRLKTRPSDITDARKTLCNIPEIRSELNDDHDTLVNCKNGVFDIDSGKLLEHNIDYRFSRCIQASYDPHAKGDVFQDFINDACCGDKELIELVQEVLGYAFSFSSCIKTAMVFYGPHDTGKSCILRLITNICGTQNVSNVNIQDYSNPCFAARIKGKALNIAPDLPSYIIKDISTFKSMVSGEDSITTKELYKNPQSTPCKTKHLFGANQFMQLDRRLTRQNIEAFMNRLLFIPFMNQKAPEDMNRSLSKELFEERDHIFTWAMQGLIRLYKNNWCFSKCRQSEAILNEYRCQYSLESSFFNEYLERDPDSILFTTDVQEAYEKYVSSMGLTCGKHDIVQYVKNTHPNIYNPKKRCKGQKSGRAVYEGLRFKENNG